MREEEKIQAGIMFCPADPELKAIKLKTHNLNMDYNNTHEDETVKRAAILAEIIGEFGEGGFIQGPIAFHYGIHTRIGKNFFGNFNLTIQDDAEVTIGDNCNFGPNATIVTPMHPMVADERRLMLTAGGEKKAPLLCKAGTYRQRLLVRRFGDRLPRRYHRGQLRNRRGKRCNEGYPGEQLCCRRTLPGHTRDNRGGQYEIHAGDTGG